MFREMSQDEVERANERLRSLYVSSYLEDQITAVLMDTRRGGSGLSEDTARQKMHAILDWLRDVYRSVPLNPGRVKVSNPDYDFLLGSGRRDPFIASQKVGAGNTEDKP
jgi:hypothetical protein